MVVKLKWKLTYKTYLTIHTQYTIGLVIFHHNYRLAERQLCNVYILNVLNIIGHM